MDDDLPRLHTMDFCQHLRGETLQAAVMGGDPTAVLERWLLSQQSVLCKTFILRSLLVSNSDTL